MRHTLLPSRRGFLKAAAATATGVVLPAWAFKQAPAVIVSAAERPQALQGLHFGDPAYGSAVVWSRSDRPARMLVDWSYNESFTNARRLVGPHALETTDFTPRQDLDGLEPGSEVFVRVAFQSLDNSRALSEPVRGRFVVLPAPLFFIHSGDTIYADGPIAASVVAENGLVWNNLVTAEVSKVAETLEEFRGRHRYNLLDENVRRFNAEVPQIWQWDDHEVTNNWSDAKNLSGDSRYTEKNVPLLIARGARAFLEYAPMRPFDAREAQRVYRKYSYGPLLELFVLDMRSYRGPNSTNLQTAPSEQTLFLGREQLDWLKAGLEDSRAVWKVVAAPSTPAASVPTHWTAPSARRWCSTRRRRQDSRTCRPSAACSSSARSTSRRRAAT